MWVSHETIYQALYVQPKSELAKQVKEALRTGRVRRKPQGRQPQPKLKGMINIAERPAEAADRVVPGHYGISMLLSSRLSELGWRCCPGSVLAEQRPKDVDPAPGEGDDGLAVSAAVGSFLQVVVAVRAGSHHAGLRREVAHVPERAAIAQRAVQVAGAP